MHVEGDGLRLFDRFTLLVDNDPLNLVGASVDVLKGDRSRTPTVSEFLAIHKDANGVLSKQTG